MPSSEHNSLHAMTQRGTFMAEPSGVESVEARYLNESLLRLSKEISDFRGEFRTELSTRPTHSDLGSLRLLMEKEIELLTQQLKQNAERHVREIQILEMAHNTVKGDLKEIEERLDATEKDKKSLQRQVIVGFLGALGAAAGGVVWQGFIT